VTDLPDKESVQSLHLWQDYRLSRYYKFVCYRRRIVREWCWIRATNHPRSSYDWNPSIIETFGINRDFTVVDTGTGH